MIMTDDRIGIRSGTIIRGTAITCIALTLSSCQGAGGLVQPQLGEIDYTSFALADQTVAGRSDGQVKRFDMLMRSAQALDKDLYQAIWRNNVYSVATGVGMFTAGIATLAFGVFDASRTLLLAGGLATGTLAGVRSFYPFADRSQLYAKARSALQCAVQSTHIALTFDTLSTGDGAKGSSLAAVLEQARTAADKLQTATANLVAVPGTNNVRSEVGRALFVPVADANVAALRSAVDSGRVVERQLEPERQLASLANALTRIHAIVDEEVDKLSPNPQAALDAARAQLTANLTAVKTSAIESRDLARQVDNNKIKAAAQPPPAGREAATERSTPLVQATSAANAAAVDATNAASQLQAEMSAITSKLTNLDSCLSTLTPAGT